MAGTSGKPFTPNGTLSRGMIVQILYSLEGKPETDADSVFDDVKAGAWYADAVNWAASPTRIRCRLVHRGRAVGCEQRPDERQERRYAGP